jgi:hypothetical protein
MCAFTRRTNLPPMSNSGLGSEEPSVGGVGLNVWPCSGLLGDSRVCFEKIQIKNPYELIFSACLFMHYWIGLYATEDQAMIRAGVETMMTISMEMLKKI